MALTPVQEAQVLDLIAQQSALLSLASSEATIISKLGATKKNISQATAATALNDTDLMFVRQGTTDKSTTTALIKSYLGLGVTPPLFDNDLSPATTEFVQNLFAAQTGVISGVLSPVVAPSLAAPAKILTNGNGEVFLWTGSTWKLIANGVLLTQFNDTPLTVPNGTTQILETIICPRAGRVRIDGNILFANSQARARYAQINAGTTAYYNFSGNTTVSPNGVFDSSPMGGVDNVAQGQIITLSVYSDGGSSNISSSSLSINYIG